MGATKDVHGDAADARGHAAEESSAAQPTHYLSRMDVSAGERHTSDAGASELVQTEGSAARSGVRAQPPEEFTGVEIKEAEDVAGGGEGRGGGGRGSGREEGRGAVGRGGAPGRPPRRHDP